MAKNNYVRTDVDNNMATQLLKPSSEACWYRRVDGPWKPRKDLTCLKIGQRLFATRLPESDLLHGKTGPKVFLECGVGKRNNKGKWSIVNGMVRIGKRGMKTSVVRKKTTKMPQNTLLEVYVSKIRLDEGGFEVCMNREEALEKGSLEGKIPASSLKEGVELTGIVKGVKPYGVFIDVNANRNGLIHIKKIANRYDKYVNKEDGLTKLGLGRGSSVNVIVVTNGKKRLELDLAPPPVIEEIPADIITDADSDDSDSTTANDDSMSEDEASAWAAYGADEGSQGSSASEDEAAMWAAYSNDDEGEDDYDEDKDIEDAMGIGSY
eukprot:CAMPEP_0201884638 /NCGR_PEP_ID=MMETSP0902-20130614/17472_1 /ASSEMBLY_ACC=CAM_ASM_000551 /TAXON_ID=420261 /ORGANISM="Thalassiosira antarctica, Strain CCMP982" /LENGTH=321 /DNA_ID=CAMNT_0048413635 /DNA_START=72 /DNA_END=1037 /DNA_ORIENTATION=+